MATIVAAIAARMNVIAIAVKIVAVDAAKIVIVAVIVDPNNVSVNAAKNDNQNHHCCCVKSVRFFVVESNLFIRFV